MKNKLLRKLRPLMALSLIYPLTACETILTQPTTDVSCEVFCDMQYDPLKSHPRDIVQSKTHNARRKSLGCAPKACQVDVDMLDEVKASQEALKSKVIPQEEYPGIVSETEHPGI